MQTPSPWLPPTVLHNPERRLGTKTSRVVMELEGWGVAPGPPGRTKDCFGETRKSAPAFLAEESLLLLTLQG